MADLAVTNTFVAGTTAVASQVNQNFTDIITYVNNRNSGSSSWDAIKVDGAAVFNEAGGAVDFRVEGDTNVNALFVKGSNNRVGIGTATPNSNLQVKETDDVFLTVTSTDTDSRAVISLANDVASYFIDIEGADGDKLRILDGSSNKLITFASGAGPIVFNEDGTATLDVRMEGDSNVNLFFLDASADRIGIGTATPNSNLQVSNTDDVFLTVTSTAADSRAVISLANDAVSYFIDIEGADNDKLRILDGSSNKLLTFSSGAGEVVFNEDGTSTLDVRMESDNVTSMFFLDASADLIFFGGQAVGTTVVAFSSGAIAVGNATSGLRAAGTINVATDVFKNNTAYSNPDYVLEKWVTGKIEKFIDNEGAKEYQGLRSLEDIEKATKQNFCLPLVNEARERLKNEGGLGIFSGGDSVLASLEEAYIHLFNLNKRISALETITFQ